MHTFISRLGLRPLAQALFEGMPFRTGAAAGASGKPQRRVEKPRATALRSAPRYRRASNRLEVSLFVSTLMLAAWQSLETLAAVWRAIGA